MPTQKEIDHARTRLFNIIDDKSLTNDQVTKKISRRTKAMTKSSKLKAWLLALVDINYHTEAKDVLNKMQSS